MRYLTLLTSVSTSPYCNKIYEKFNKKQNEISALRKITGCVAGVTVGTILSKSIPIVYSNLTLVKQMKNAHHSYEMYDLANQMMTEFSLDKKGVKIHTIDAFNYREKDFMRRTIYKDYLSQKQKSLICKCYEKIPYLKNINETIYYKYLKTISKIFKANLDGISKKNIKFKHKIDQFVSSVSFGINALYLPKSNIIFAPNSNHSLLFHEIGHAINRNSNVLLKKLQIYSRVTSQLAPTIILATALLTPKKNKDEKNNGIINKTTNFIKEHSGKLTFLSFVPMILEEALASARGISFVKKTMGNNIGLKLSKTYAFALSSYISLAIAASIGTNLALKIKNKITKEN